MADVTISDLTAAVSIDGSTDYFPLDQSGTTKKINRNVFLGVTGTPADISTAQNLTNKTLNNTNTVTLLDTLFTLQDNSVTTKQVQFNLTDISSATTRTFRFPDVSDILVTESATQGLANKTLTSPTINGGTISNATISVDAIAEYTAANGVTVDGLNIKDGKLNTNNSVVTANVTDSAITPAKLLTGTGSTWAYGTWTPTWTNLTIGNATVVAHYIQTGKTVDFWIDVQLGNTSSVGSDPNFSLPVTASAAYVAISKDIGHNIANVEFLDAGTASYPGTGRLSSTTTCTLFAWAAGSTYVSTVGVSSTVPFTFVNTDRIFITGSYEAA